MKPSSCFVILSSLLFAHVVQASASSQKIESLLSQMTLEEKVGMLSGDETGFNVPGVERLGIPEIFMADGPVGVRNGQSTAFPVSVNMAASWDTALIHKYGNVLAEETLAKGKNCILGPCVGVQRFPLGGRNFESFGEDPFLSAMMAVDYIQGVQELGAIATIKHYAANDQEWKRTETDSIVSERALREVHLLPFEYGIKEGGAWILMSSYNLVNGHHASENHHLLTDILKEDWGFKGLVVSDWVSTYSAAKAANAGLDLEMPNGVWFGDRLLEAVKSGKVAESVIDDKIRRHLLVRLEMGLFDNPNPAPDQSVIESDAHRDMARVMAEQSITLLKNDGLLPLESGKHMTIALIGPNALEARSGGGGSSQVEPWIKVSPLEGLRNLLGDEATILTAEGLRLSSPTVIPVPVECLHTPDGKPGLRGEYFANMNFEGEPAFVRTDSIIDFRWASAGPAEGFGVDHFSIRWTGTYTPTVSGNYRIGTRSDDGSRLYIDGKLLVENWGNHDMSQAVLGNLKLEAGHAYELRIDYCEDGGDAGVALVCPDPSVAQAEPTVAGAVEAARKADVVIMCVGNTADFEAEGKDIASFDMPRGQNELIEAVLAVNKNAVVVMYGGTAFHVTDWVDDVPALLEAYYPGQEGGTALAEILFGEVNPSGKLPFSFIQDASQSPGFNNYMNPDLRAPYDEGVFVGYKWYESHDVKPLFPFGHGLSYTSFAYSNLKIRKTGEWTAEVSVDVSNSGQREGAEVVQLYVGQNNPSEPRPIKELRAFNKVSLTAGQTQTVMFKLDYRAFRYWDEAANGWRADNDTFTIYVGASSADLRASGEVTF